MVEVHKQQQQSNGVLGILQPMLIPSSSDIDDPDTQRTLWRQAEMHKGAMYPKCNVGV